MNVLMGCLRITEKILLMFNKARIHGYIHNLVIIIYNRETNALIAQTELHLQPDLLKMLSIYTL
jgi:hypothetical protein